MGSLLKVIGLGVVLAAGLLGVAGLASGSIGLVAFAVLLGMVGAYALVAGAREGGGTGGVAQAKSCPDCAEPVRAAARKCRFCGYAFGESAIPQAGPSTATRSGPAEPLVAGLWASIKEDLVSFLPGRSASVPRQDDE